MDARRVLARFIKRYRLTWAWTTLAAYVVALPVTFFLFPANSLWLALLVLFSGFTASLTTVADLLVNAEGDGRQGHDLETPASDQ